MKSLALTSCLFFFACYSASGNETTSPYRNDFISLGVEKRKNPNPEAITIGITGGTRDMDERWYFEQCFKRIQSNNKGGSPRQGAARIEYTVGLNGELEQVLILKSSGYLDLDKHLKSLVEQSAPFPPFPKSLSIRAHKVRIIQTIALSKN